MQPLEGQEDYNNNLDYRESILNQEIRAELNRLVQREKAGLSMTLKDRSDILRLKYLLKTMKDNNSYFDRGNDWTARSWGS